MRTIRDICCAFETLVGSAYFNRFTLSSWEAGVSHRTAKAVCGNGGAEVGRT